MARVLGLDLGSYSIKAVLFETTMRNYQTRVFAQVPLPPPKEGQDSTPSARLKAALGELFSKHGLMAEQVVVALPGPSLATHVLTLPFTDTKRIEATIPFEVESQLPFDLSDAVYDYQLASIRDKKSELLIGVVRKAELQSLLATLQDVKIDPRIVTHPGITLQNLLISSVAPGGAEEGEPAVAVVDIGHERTSIAIGRPSLGVELARTFAGGGKNLTQALATEFQVDFDEAQRWKEAHGALGESVVGPDAERAAGAFVRGLQPILRELRPTLKAFAARTHVAIERVLLCGGTARMKGLEVQLGRDLGIPTERLQLPLESANVIGAEEQPLAAQAYALALRGQASGAKAPRFNLRRGEFAFKGDFDYVRDKVPQLLAFAASLLLLLIASGVVRNQVLASREAKVDAMLCDVTQRVLGTCEKSYDRALNMLQGKESPAAVIPRISAVSLLAELSQRLPTDIPVTVEQVVVDLDRITVRCETDSSKNVDKITTALKAFRCFKEVQEGKLEKSKDGQKVTFRLDIQVECPETSTPQG